MKGKDVFRFIVIAALLLATICSSAFCQQAQTYPCKPKVLLEGLTAPVLFAQGQVARLVINILPCDICQTNGAPPNGPGIAPATPGNTPAPKTVHFKLSLRTAFGLEIENIEGDAAPGSSFNNDITYDPADFGNLNNANVIATLCVTDNSTYKKKTTCSAIVTASLIIFSQEGDEFETDSVTPLTPLAFFGPGIVRF